MTNELGTVLSDIEDKVKKKRKVLNAINNIEKDLALAFEQINFNFLNGALKAMEYRAKIDYIEKNFQNIETIRKYIEEN